MVIKLIQTAYYMVNICSRQIEVIRNHKCCLTASFSYGTITLVVVFLLGKFWNTIGILRSIYSMVEKIFGSFEGTTLDIDVGGT